MKLREVPQLLIALDVELLGVEVEPAGRGQKAFAEGGRPARLSADLRERRREDRSGRFLLDRPARRRSRPPCSGRPAGRPSQTASTVSRTRGSSGGGNLGRGEPAASTRQRVGVEFGGFADGRRRSRSRPHSRISCDYSWAVVSAAPQPREAVATGAGARSSASRQRGGRPRPPQYPLVGVQPGLDRRIDLPQRRFPGRPACRCHGSAFREGRSSRAGADIRLALIESAIPESAHGAGAAVARRGGRGISSVRSLSPPIPYMICRRRSERAMSRMKPHEVLCLRIETPACAVPRG